MKKSLIALAVAGALVAPAAMADTANVTIYGAANMSFDVVSSGSGTTGAGGTGTPVSSASTNHVASNTSKLGFKGAENLGDGLSAIWQIEQQINMDNTTQAGGTGTFGTRNTFAGLSSKSMGTVILGRADTPYKSATRGLDLFADGVADNRAIMGQTTAGGSEDARVTDVAQYTSPDMSGFSVAFAAVAAAETANSAATKGGFWSLAGMYNAGPIYATLAFQNIDNGTSGSGTAGGILGAQAAGAPTSKSTAWKLGGSYTMDALKLNAVYEKLGSSGAIGNANDRSAWYLAGQYNVSSIDAVKLAYTSAGKVNSVVDTEATQFTVGYDHNLSKRTTVYALYSKLTNKAAAKYAFNQGTSIVGDPATTFNADPSVFSLGMKHAF